MANKRAAGKRLIGAQASAELWAGVDLWLKKHPRQTVTDFILSACLDKLQEAGISVDENMALRDGRARVPGAGVRYPEHAPNHSVLNTSADPFAVPVSSAPPKHGGVYIAPEVGRTRKKRRTSSES